MAHEHGPHVCYCPNCGHRLTADTGVRCNTWTCPICGSQMRALETGENRETRLSRGVPTIASVPTPTKSLACPVCGYPIPEPGPAYSYPSSLNRTVRCAYCGTISEVISDITVPNSVVVGIVCFFAGGLLMAPLLQAIKSGAGALERVTRERIR